MFVCESVQEKTTSRNTAVLHTSAPPSSSSLRSVNNTDASSRSSVNQPVRLYRCWLSRGRSSPPLCWLQLMSLVSSNRFLTHGSDFFSPKLHKSLSLLSNLITSHRNTYFKHCHQNTVYTSFGFMLHCQMYQICRNCFPFLLFAKCCSLFRDLFFFVPLNFCYSSKMAAIL